MSADVIYDAMVTRVSRRASEASLHDPSAVFLRAANFGGSSVFSPATVAKRLELVNIRRGWNFRRAT